MRGFLKRSESNTLVRIKVKRKRGSSCKKRVIQYNSEIYIKTKYFQSDPNKTVV